ncbi:hypothetical protein [Pseudomonas sp. 22 E 5]|nr:hypothetical protein [Pseudomonas sp. 22 E 5]
MPNLLIPLQGSGEHCTQFTLFVPTTVVAQRKALEIQQLTQGLFKDWFQGFDVGAAVFIYFVAGQAQLSVPGRLRSGVKCTMPQPRVPLPKGLLQALPGSHETWFHVEHTPIEELPADFRRTFQQTKAVRVDQLQRQDFCQLRSTTSILPIDANLELSATVTGYPQAAVPTLSQLNLTKYRARQLLVLDNR